MDMFQYVTVLTSVIIGLGIAHLLHGLARLIPHCPHLSRPGCTRCVFK
jgi:hypothetical protein